MQFVQFRLPGQKLWQYEVLTKPYLAGFGVVQPVTNQEPLLFFLAPIS